MSVDIVVRGLVIAGWLGLLVLVGWAMVTARRGVQHVLDVEDERRG